MDKSGGTKKIIIYIIIVILLFVGLFILINNIIQKNKTISTIKNNTNNYLSEVEKYIENHNNDPKNYPIELKTGVRYQVDGKSTTELYINSIIKTDIEKPTSGSIIIGENNKVSLAELVVSGYRVSCSETDCDVKAEADSEIINSTSSTQTNETIKKTTTTTKTKTITKTETKTKEKTSTKQQSEQPKTGTTKVITATLSYNEVAVGKNQSPSLNVSQGYDKITYSSNNINIVKVNENSGVITGVHPGSTTIHATVYHGGTSFTVSANVNVYRYQIIRKTCSETNKKYQKTTRTCNDNSYYNVTKKTCNGGPCDGNYCLPVEPYWSTSVTTAKTCTVEQGFTCGYEFNYDGVYSTFGTDDYYPGGQLPKRSNSGRSYISNCEKVSRYEFGPYVVTDNLSSCQEHVITCNQNTVGQTSVTCSESKDYSFVDSVSKGNECVTENQFTCSAGNNGKSYVHSCIKIYE